MTANLRSQANKWLIIGFVAGFGGNAIKGMYAANPMAVSLGWLVFLAGMGIFIYGCMLYAEAKGQNKWLGLLGIVSLLGLIVLFFLPDKNK